MKLFLSHMLEAFPDLLESVADLSPDLIKNYNKASVTKKLDAIESFAAEVSRLKDPALCHELFTFIANFLLQYRLQDNTIFKMSPSLLNELRKTKSNIPLSFLLNHMSDDRVYHVELGREYPIHSGKTSCLFATKNEGILRVVFPCIREGYHASGFAFTHTEDARDAGTLQDVVDSAPAEAKELLADGLKSLLYIESAEPDVCRVPPEVSKTTNPKKQRRFLKNHCPFDLTNVGFSFHGRRFYKSETTRVAHFRWQPYGPGRSKVKLIRIEETTVTYNKEQRA